MPTATAWHRPNADELLMILQIQWKSDQTAILRLHNEINAGGRPSPQDLLRLAGRYETCRMFARAEEYYNKALALAEEVRAQCIEELRQLYASQPAPSPADEDAAKARLVLAKDDYADVLNLLGHVQTSQARYIAAEHSYEMSIDNCSGFPYAYDNLATLYWWNGSYELAHDSWGEARIRYERTADIARQDDNVWAGHFFAQGNLLYQAYGELDAAERAYAEGNRLDATSCDACLGRLKITIERLDGASAKTAGDFWAVRKAFEEGLAAMVASLADGVDLDAVITIGEMYLLVGKLEEARQVFTAARRFDDWCERDGYSRSAAPTANLAVVAARRKLYDESLELFEQAVTLDGDDLVVQSNLAEAYLRKERTDDAEREYLAILRRAPGHLESHVGLADIHIERAEKGDSSAFEDAIAMLDGAIELAARGRGSKRLTGPDLAKLHYLRGFARTRLAIHEHGAGAAWQIHNARNDFRNAMRIDSNLHIARHAHERIKAAYGPATMFRWMEGIMPVVIVVLALLLLIASVVLLAGIKASGKLIMLSPLEFVTTAFGTIALMIAGAYLPRILKLKVAGVEIEKGTIDNIDTVNLMSISRGKFTA